MILKKYFIKKAIGVLVLLLLTVFASCKKSLDVGPPKTQLVSSLVFGNDATATDALISIYGDMSSSRNFISLNNVTYTGQSADELVSYASPVTKYYGNSLDNGVDDFWTGGYKYIYRANAVIDGLNSTTALTDSVKRQLNGEALFIRAYCHFYMVNLFGDVPYINTTDYQANNLAVRQPVAQVYQQIITDLLASRNLLTDKFATATNGLGTDRVRPNKAAVTALLARTYLYTGNWTQAEAEATSIINKTGVYSLPSNLNAVFLKNSTETIWQLMPASTTSVNGLMAPNFVLIFAPSTISALSDQVYNAFEVGDNRKTSWVGTFTNGSGSWHYPYKYKAYTTSSTTVVTEYTMMFRLAEQYLIRAEARANQNNIAGAVADINILRARARTTATSLPDYAPTMLKDACLAAIAHERQVELFTEGHRWYDLKRTGQADAVLGPLKGANWQSTDALYPIPLTQLRLDPNMAGAQNPGYN